jgi:sec-independent protein translocase protein TatC
MARSSHDLFDDSTMSFGEHLEVLRVHLFKALTGVAIGVVVALFYGSSIIGIVRQPIDRALRDYGHDIAITDDAEALQEIDFWARVKGYVADQFSLDVLSDDEEEEDTLDGEEAPGEVPGDPQQVDNAQADPQANDGAAQSATASAPAVKKASARNNQSVRVSINAGELGAALHKIAPEAYPQPPAEAHEQTVTLTLTSPKFALFQSAYDRSQQVVALNVQEPFLTYLKVSMIAGLVIASPWVFYQLWQFIAAGLFPHERKFVYLYGTLSGLLFLIGVVFCFYMVFPFVLKFLLGFNQMLGIEPQIRLSEWISFAVTLPLLFGVSFQLPLVMLFLERLSIFEEHDYREKRRMAILVIAILSMFLTPADPISMMMMMIPLCGLYELGILLCRLSPAKSPFDGELATT